jgi:hypothetical protein
MARASRNLFMPVNRLSGLAFQKEKEAEVSAPPINNNNVKTWRASVFLRIGIGRDRGNTLKDDHTVSHVGGHDEIVLNNKGSLLRVKDEPLDDLGSHDTLLRVKVGGRLVNQVDVGLINPKMRRNMYESEEEKLEMKRKMETHGLAKTEDKGNTLKLTTREVLNLLVHETLHLEGTDDVGLELGVVDHVPDL